MQAKPIQIENGWVAAFWCERCKVWGYTEGDPVYPTRAACHNSIYSMVTSSLQDAIDYAHACGYAN